MDYINGFRKNYFDLWQIICQLQYFILPLLKILRQDYDSGQASLWSRTINLDKSSKEPHFFEALCFKSSLTT